LPACLTVLAVVIAGTLPAQAAIVSPVPERLLTEGARVIVIGRVASITSHWDPAGQILTDVKIMLDEILKGTVTAPELTIRQLGGRVGDVESRVEGSPAFRVGERVLLFLTTRRDGTLRVAHLYLGKFSLLTDLHSGETLARRQTPEGVIVTSPPGSGTPPPTDELHRLRDLTDRIRGILGSLPVRPGRGVTAPLFTPPAPLGTTDAQASYTFLGTPSRWFEPDAGGAVAMSFNADGEPRAPSRGLDQVGAAYAAWSSVSGSSFRFHDAGTTTAMGHRRDGISAISFGDPLGQMDDPVNCSGVLAMGGYFSTSSQTRTVNGQRFNRIVEGDVVVNRGWDGCGVYERFANLAEVVTHELGHALGLGHSADGDATMAARAHFDGRGASLRADDMAGLRFIYPASAADPPPAAGSPDLVVSALSAPGSVLAGDRLSINDTTRNQGDAAAGASTTRYFLSRDATLDTGDAVLGSRALGSLAAGAASSSSTSVTIPTATSAGSYYLLARADADGGVGESSEGNNVSGIPLTVTQISAAGDVIVDNAPAGVQDTASGRTFSGRWCTSAAANPYGGGSLYSCGFRRDTYGWVPRLPASGTYDVYVWWTATSSRSTRVPITVNHAAGSTTRTFNQQTGGGRWQLHGRYTFTTGSVGSVGVSDANGQASADAVRFVRVP
jgi:hypothetical protein